MRVSSKLFSMPPGSAFTSDPFIVEGMSVSRLTASKELQRAESSLFNYRSRNVIQIYDADALTKPELTNTEQESADALKKAQEIHE